jgi:tetratricopeptide (TPR) repeat protein
MTQNTPSRRPARAAALAGALALALAACAGTALPPQLVRRIAPRQQLEVPFQAQNRLQCGPAALAMALTWSGSPVEADALAERVFTATRGGSLQHDLVSGARRQGRIPYPVRDLAELLGELGEGRPVVVLQNLGFSWYPYWHYALAVGYDLDAGELLLHSGPRPNYRLRFDVFERTWARGERWARVILPAQQLPVALDEAASLEAIAAAEQAAPAQAAQAFLAAAERWPRSAAAWLGAGNARYHAADLAGAEAAFRRATELDPALGPAWNNLAQVLHERGDDPAARETLQRALQLGGPWRETYERTLREIGAP